MKWSFETFPHKTRIGIASVILFALAIVLFIASRATCPHGCNERTLGCSIKGNIRRGEKIYHLSSDRYYDDTIVNPERGEAYFCTEEEARENGFRKALQP